jgi:hypothetical protein
MALLIVSVSLDQFSVTSIGYLWQLSIVQILIICGDHLGFALQTLNLILRLCLLIDNFSFSVDICDNCIIFDRIHQF